MSVQMSNSSPSGKMTPRMIQVSSGTVTSTFILMVCHDCASIRDCNCLNPSCIPKLLEAKFPHAAVFCILPGYELPNGKRHYPLAAMVANLAKPTPERPALMGHFEVTTLFHEMGHIFHELLSRTRYSRFHGTTVALDFAEAPSQMLENWSDMFLFSEMWRLTWNGSHFRCWEPEVLKKMSSHYKTQDPLPDDLITKIIKRLASML